jgi:hypothetical protein
VRRTKQYPYPPLPAMLKLADGIQKGLRKRLLIPCVPQSFISEHRGGHHRHMLGPRTRLIRNVGPRLRSSRFRPRFFMIQIGEFPGNRLLESVLGNCSNSSTGVRGRRATSGRNHLSVICPLATTAFAQSKGYSAPIRRPLLVLERNQLPTSICYLLAFPHSALSSHL